MQRACGPAVPVGGCTFHEVGADVLHNVAAGGGAGQGMSEAETRLAAVGVLLLEVVEARLAPARAHACLREVARRASTRCD